MTKLSDPVRPDCISPEDIALYFSGDAPPAKHLAIENHLLQCPYCNALAEQVADATQELYEQELAREPALAFLQDADLSVFGQGNRTAILERIGQWIRTGAELAAGLLLPVSRPISFVVSEMGAMLSPHSGFNLAEAHGAAFLGMRGTRGGNDLEGPILEIPGQGERRARVVVDIGAVTRVSVQIDNVPATMVPPLVALRLGTPPRVLMKEMAKLQTLSGDSSVMDMVAEFEVPEAVREVLVVVEPLTQ